MYSEENIDKFLSDLSSENSIPGGGSAAALVGAVTASVVAFIANLTIGKKKYRDVEPEAKEILSEAQNLKDELLEMVDKDSEILSEILECYKQGDSEKIAEVCKRAVDFSMEMTEKCVNLMELGLHISKIGNRMLASDFEVAAYLGDGAVNSAIANVKINLGSIEDTEYVADIRNTYNRLSEKSAAIRDEIVEIAN